MEYAFRARLGEGRPIVADGAMGTQIYARGVSYDDCFDYQVIERPDLVESIHRAYIDAGAELIETNTFGANRIRLAAHGLEDRVNEINQRAARLARGAREICGKPVFVAGSVGPTSRTLLPYGNTEPQIVLDAFREQIAALLQGGVDLLVLETFSDLAEIALAIQAARELSDLPIVAQMTFAEDVRTPRGHSPQQVAETLGALAVDVIGANCSVGPNSLLEVTEGLVAASPVPVSAMPNAGFPARVDGRLMYLTSPEYFADYGRRMADLGAVVVGGCCGTTPAHIAALVSALHDLAGPRPSIEPVHTDEPESALLPDVSDASSLAGKLGVQRVISVEIRPPRGANPAKALQGAEILRAAGADAVNVLDSAMARVRMSAVATAVLVHQYAGIDTILHFTSRDRNLMAIQSDLIGAHALGVRNVLALTGDPPSLGDYAHSKAVYDVDSIGLIRVIKQLNQGVDVGGNSIGTPTSFLVGCALNPTAEDLPSELDRFHQKLEAGADFIMTQPVYDAELFRKVLEQVPSGVPVLAGILPLQSYRHALFIHNELPGVTLTAEALHRMEAAGANGIDEGLNLAREMIAEIGPLVAGLYIIPSFGRYEVAAHLVSELMVAV